MKVDIGGGVRLFFDVAGSGLEATDEALADKPTLLLLHGGPGMNHSYFRPYFDRFADTHQVVYLDHRGQGRSDARNDSSRWDLDTWADDVVRFCDAVAIHEPIVLGNSFGGFVAIHYAARHPHHPARLLLSSTLARENLAASAARFEERGGPEARASYERVFVHGDRAAEAWDDYRRVNLPLYSTRPSSFAADRPRRNQLVMDHWESTTDQTALDLREDLRLVTKPTLVIGGAEDPMTTREAQREMFDHLCPDIRRLESLDDCGHLHWHDQPERTETIFRNFFAGNLKV